MNDQRELSERFQAGSIRAHLHCIDDYCTLDVGVERNTRQHYDHAVVEVLLQPRTPVGIPFGRPASVLCRSVRISGLPGDRYAWGRMFLPLALRPLVARSCYYRVNPGVASGQQ